MKGQGGVDPLTRPVQVPRHVPEAPERADEPQSELGIVIVDGKVQCGMEVPGLDVQRVQPAGRFGPGELGMGFVGKCQVRGGVTASRLGRLTALVETLDGELTDQLQHHEA